MEAIALPVFTWKACMAWIDRFGFRGKNTLNDVTIAYGPVSERQIQVHVGERHIATLEPMALTIMPDVLTGADDTSLWIVRQLLTENMIRRETPGYGDMGPWTLMRDDLFMDWIGGRVFELPDPSPAPAVDQWNITFEIEETCTYEGTMAVDTGDWLAKVGMPFDPNNYSIEDMRTYDGEVIERNQDVTGQVWSNPAATRFTP